MREQDSSTRVWLSSVVCREGAFLHHGHEVPAQVLSDFTCALTSWLLLMNLSVIVCDQYKHCVQALDRPECGHDGRLEPNVRNK